MTAIRSIHILNLTVFKRLAAYLLALIFVSQLLAGVCLCFEGEQDSHSKMSCCKPDKSGKASVSRAMDCCEEACGEPTGGIPGSTNFSSAQISAPILTAVENLIASLKLKPNLGSAILISKRAGDIPQLSIKPPELYLQNHAFLI